MSHMVKTDSVGPDCDLLCPKLRSSACINEYTPYAAARQLRSSVPFADCGNDPRYELTG